MAIHREHKDIMLLRERGIPTGRVPKDITLQWGKWVNGYSDLRNGVTLLWEKGNVAIIRVFQDVRLLGEEGNVTLLRVLRDAISG